MNDDLPGLQKFIEFLGSPAMLTLIGTGIVCLLAGLLTGTFLRRHRGLAGVQPPCALTLRYVFLEGLVAVSPPLVALLVAVLIRALLYSLQADASLLNGAMPLVALYAVVRIGVLVVAASLGNRFWLVHWEVRLTVLIWLVLAAED